MCSFRSVVVLTFASQISGDLAGNLRHLYTSRIVLGKWETSSPTPCTGPRGCPSAASCLDLLQQKKSQGDISFQGSSHQMMDCRGKRALSLSSQLSIPRGPFQPHRTLWPWLGPLVRRHHNSACPQPPPSPTSFSSPLLQYLRICTQERPPVTETHKFKTLRCCFSSLKWGKNPKLWQSICWQG